MGTRKRLKQKIDVPKVHFHFLCETTFCSIMPIIKPSQIVISQRKCHIFI
jgi:hypothetical protein